MKILLGKLRQWMLFGLGICCVSGAVFGAGKADDKVYPWQEAMQRMKENYNPIRKAEDGKAILGMKAQAEAVAKEFKGLTELYKNPDAKKVESAVKVLDDWEEFEKLNTKATTTAEELVKAIGGGDETAVKGLVTTMNVSCKVCHKKYR